MVPSQATRVFESTPNELREKPQWVCWRYEQRDGKPKPTKVPYDARSGRRASTTKPATWSPFDDAVAAFNAGKYDGIGFVFNNDFIGVDLDNAIDPATGKLKPWAQAIVDRCPTYCELSPSGTGIHLISKGRLSDGQTGTKKPYHDGVLEIYSTSRYFTFTGKELPRTQ